MNWDTIKGNWSQMTGKVKEEWGDLTDDDLTEAAGERDQLVGKIQARYGVAKDEAERQVDSFVAKHYLAWILNRKGGCYSRLFRVLGCRIYQVSLA